MNAVPSPAGSPIASPVKIAKPTAEGGEKKKKDKKRKSEGMAPAASDDVEEHVAVVDADVAEPEKKKVSYMSFNSHFTSLYDSSCDSILMSLSILSQHLHRKVRKTKPKW